MKGYFFYNLKILGDVLVIVIKEDSYTRKESYKDIEFLYKEDELVQVHLKNISSVCKIVAQGRIVMPPKSLVDYVNQSIIKYHKGRIDYVNESGFIVGNVISYDGENYIIDLKNELTEASFTKEIPLNSLVVYALKGTKLINNSFDSFNFTLKESEGRICSYRDLGISDSEDIVVLDKKDAKTGEDFFLS